MDECVGPGEDEDILAFIARITSGLNTGVRFTPRDNRFALCMAATYVTVSLSMTG